MKFDLSPYEDVIATLYEELKGKNNVTRPSLRFEEAQRVQMILESLENKLINLKQFLPKPERRRGLLNLGGNFLKMLFGTATVADLHGLHTEVDVMRKKQETIVHSVNRQVTLVTQLDGVVRHNQDTLTNLNAIVKDYVLKVQDKFQNYGIQTRVVSETTRSGQCSKEVGILHYAVGSPTGGAFKCISGPTARETPTRFTNFYPVTFYFEKRNFNFTFGV